MGGPSFRMNLYQLLIFVYLLMLLVPKGLRQFGEHIGVLRLGLMFGLEKTPLRT